jgi:hypothetical protein
LTLFCQIYSIGFGPEPCAFPLRVFCWPWESLTEDLLDHSTGSVTFGGCTLNSQSLPNLKWRIFLWLHQNIERKLQFHLVTIPMTLLVVPLLFSIVLLLRPPSPICKKGPVVSLHKSPYKQILHRQSTLSTQRRRHTRHRTSLQDRSRDLPNGSRRGLLMRHTTRLIIGRCYCTSRLIDIGSMTMGFFVAPLRGLHRLNKGLKNVHIVQ